MSQIGKFRKLVIGSAGESKLSQWMAQNHDAIEATLVASGRRRWSVVAAFASENDLFDGRGKAPTEQRAKETWKRVKARVARSRAAKASLGPKAAPAPRLSLTVHTSDLVQPPVQPRLSPVSPSRLALIQPPPATTRVRQPLVAEAEDDAPLPEPNYFKTLT